MRRFEVLAGVENKWMVGLGMVLLLCSASPAYAGIAFGPAINLRGINSSYGEFDPSISADGLTLFFGSNRPGGSGNSDLWMATRNSTSDYWNTPVNLGAEVNSAEGDIHPSISADGLTLYFASIRAGGEGFFDLWKTERQSTADSWQSPVKLGSPVNGSAQESGPSISSDGLSLYYSAYRPGFGLGSDLWVSTRSSLDESFGTPVNLGTTVNSNALELKPVISSDELTLFFGVRTTSPGTDFNDGDIWVTHRPTTATAWSTPTQISLNTAFAEGPGSISADGRWLYFTSNRPGGDGGMDIWMAEIVPVPEPTTLVIWSALGGLGMIVARRRRRRTA